jgi:hypothetical protein
MQFFPKHGMRARLGDDTNRNCERNSQCQNPRETSIVEHDLPGT